MTRSVKPVTEPRQHLGCALPPGWLAANERLTQQSVFSDTLQQLEPSMRDYGLEVVALSGNDPEINVSPYAGLGGGDFLFVGTSFLRSLLLCLQIATNNIDPTTVFPRLLVIDRNHFIITCWEILKTNLEEILGGNFQKIFSLVTSHLADHPNQNTQYLRFSPAALNQYIANEITTILLAIRSFDFRLVKAILDHSIIICGDWENTEIFKKIRGLCDKIQLKNIVLYPSNIVECFFEKPASQSVILRNMQLLLPTLSIHTVANFTKEQVSSGVSLGNPTRCLFVEGLVPAEAVLNRINRFSITRAHKGANPIPQKMRPEDSVISAAASTQALLANSFLVAAARRAKLQEQAASEAERTQSDANQLTA